MTNFIFDLQRFNGDSNTWFLTKEEGSSNWTLKKGDEATATDPKADTLTKLFADPRVAAGDTIKVDSTAKEWGNTTVVIDKDLTIDLNGQSVTSAVTTGYAIEVTGRTLTITDTATTAGSIAFASPQQNQGQTEKPTALVGLTGDSKLALEKGTLGDKTNTKVPLVDIASDTSTFTKENAAALACSSTDANGATVLVQATTGATVSTFTASDKLAVSSAININGKVKYYGYNSGGTPPTATSVGATVSLTSGDTVMNYTNISEALAAASDGDTVTLLKDVSNVTETINITKDITLDLGGFDITAGTVSTNARTQALLNITGNVTLKTGGDGESTIKGIGGGNNNLRNTADSARSGAIIVTGGSLTLDTSSTKKINVIATNGNALLAEGGAEVTLNAGTTLKGCRGNTTTLTYGMTAPSTGIAGRGLWAQGGSKVTIDGATVQGYNDAVRVVDSEVTVKGGAKLDGYNQCGVFITGNGTYESAKLIVEGSETVIQGYSYGISGNGSKNSGNDIGANRTDLGGTYIQIDDGLVQVAGKNGAKVTDSSYTTIYTSSGATDAVLGMYLPQLNSKTVINGGTIGGTTGIEIRSGNLEVNGGTIIGTYESYAYASNGNGSTTNGAGIAVAQHNTDQAINVTIGGTDTEGNAIANDAITIKGTVGVSVADPNGRNSNSSAPAPNVAIESGTIESTKSATYTLSGQDGKSYTSAVAGNVSDTRATVDIVGGLFKGALVSKITGIAKDTTDTSKYVITAGDDGGRYVVGKGTTIEFNGSDVDDLIGALGTGLSVSKLTVDGSDETKWTYTVGTAVAKVDDTEYTSLSEAIAAAAAQTDTSADHLVTLLNPVNGFSSSADNKISITGTVVLDLAGQAITFAGSGTTMFDVSGSGSLTIMDKVGGGSITGNSSKSTGTLISVSGNSAKFSMEGGSITSSYQILNLSGGATATITGENTSLTMKDSSDFLAIGVAGASKLDIGEGNNSRGPSINVSSTEVDEENYLSAVSVASVSSGNAATVNVYGGNIDVQNSSGVIKAIDMQGGSLNVSGGTINAAGSTATTLDSAINAAGSATVNVKGGNIQGQDYGVYQGSSQNLIISGGSTSISGEGVGAVATTNGKTVSLGAGVVYNSITTDNNSYYTKTTDGVYTFANAAFSDAGDAIDSTWAYNYGTTQQASSVDYLGAQQSISFLGDLFNADSLDAIGIQLGTGNVTLSNLDAFGTADGKFISIEGNRSIIYDNTLAASGTYNSVATFASINVAEGGTDTSLWSFKSAGADSNAFVVDKDDATKKLTWHTAREHEFTIQSNLVFDATNATNAESMASFFSIKDSIITIDKPDSLFAVASVQSANESTGEKAFWLVNSNAAYSLSMADNYLAASITSEDEFKKSTLTTANTDATSQQAVYQYTFGGGAVDSNGNPINGYSIEGGGQKISYHQKALSFAFLNNDSNIAFSIASGGSVPSDWFTFGGNSGSSVITIAKEAFAANSLQHDGATLGFYDPNNEHSGWTLAFGEKVTLENNNYYKHQLFDSLKGATSGYSYLFTGVGMDTAGFRIADVSGSTVLTYNDAAAKVSLVGTASINTSYFTSEAASLTNVENNFTLDAANNIFTINYSSIFSGLAQGQTIGITNDGYSLAFGSGVSLASGTKDSNEYDSSTRVFTGVGASVAGFNGTLASAGAALTYYDHYGQFTLATTGKDLTLASGFATAVTFNKDAKTIVLGEGAFDTNNLKNGYSIQLDSTSSGNDGYEFQLGGLKETQYKDAAWANGSRTWQSNGGQQDGYVLSTVDADNNASTEQKKNNAVTYWEQRKTVGFDVSAGDGFTMAATANDVAQGIHLGDNSVLAIDASIFGAQGTGDGAATFSLNADAVAAGYTMTLGSGYTSTGNSANLAAGNMQTVETFKNNVYFGQGADTKGYALDSDKRGITYYSQAQTFTLGGSASLNDFTNGDISKYFGVGTDGITINSDAIADGTYEQGKTISLVGARGTGEKLFIGNLTTAVDTINAVSITADEYKGIGASVAGFSKTNDTVLTYYDEYNHFKLAESDSNKAVVFNADIEDRWNDESLLAAAISVDSDHKIYINNFEVFDTLSTKNGATLAIAEGYRDSYSFVFGGDLTIGSADVNTVGWEKAEAANTYTYSSVGADKQGFLATDSINGFTFYEESEKFDLTSDFKFASIVGAGVGISVGGEGNTTPYLVTIGSAAFASLGKDDDGKTISIGTGTKSSTQYGLVLAYDTDATSNFKKTGWVATDTFTADATTENILGTYKFAGAQSNGFIESLGADKKATLATYHAKSDDFSIVGSGITFSDGFKSKSSLYFNPTAGNTVVSFISDSAFDTISFKTGNTIYIANPDASIQSNQYTLQIGGLTAATSVIAQDTLTGSGNTFSYKSKGADTAGFEDDGKGTLTYYEQRTFDFSIYSAKGLNTSLGTGEVKTLPAGMQYGNILNVITVSGGNQVNLGRDAFASLNVTWEQDDIISVAAASGNATYSLGFADGSGHTKLDSVNETVSVTATKYIGRGAADTGFYGSGAVLTYYDKSKTFNLKDANGITFATTLAAWGEDSINSAIAVNSSVITINDLAVFDSSKLNNRSTIALSDTSDATYDLKFADNYTIAASDVQSVGTLTGGDKNYTYTFEGATKDGFLAGDSVFTFYKESDTLGITSDVVFNLGNISTQTAENMYFNIDGTAHKITLTSGALDFSNIKAGDQISVGDVDGNTYSFVLGSGLNDAANTMSAPTFNTVDASIGSYIFREAGVRENAFNGLNTSTLTYVAPAKSAILTGGVTYISNAIPYISISEDKVVSIGASALNTSQNIGASLGLSSVSGNLGYTLDLSAFKDANNTYYDTATLVTGESNTASYTSTGMSSVAGFNVEGNQTSLASATWYDKATVIGFDTSGGISFTTSGAANYITIGSGFVSIGAGALAADTWFSAANLSITSSGYQLAIGDGLKNVTGKTYNGATLSGNMFTEAGVEGGGYSIVGGALTYYANPQSVLFGFSGGLAFATGAADSIMLDGKNVLVSDAALNTGNLAGDGTAIIRITSPEGYKFSFDKDMMTDAGTVNTSETFTNLTYKGKGAEKDGYVLGSDSRSAAYWKAYDTFTFSTGDLLNDSANASSFTIGSSDASSTVKTISIADGVFSTATSGASLVLDTLSTSKGYQLVWTKDILSSVDANHAAYVDTVNSAYHAQGAVSNGYVLSGNKDSLTYYQQSEHFKFVVMDNGAESLVSWNPNYTQEDLATNRIGVEGSGTSKTVTFYTAGLFDTSSLKGDGTEQFSITSDNGITYKLSKDTWTTVTETTAGGLKSNVLSGAGAVFNGGTAVEGVMESGNALTYYRKAAEVTLGGSAEFSDISENIADYFTIADNTVTFKDKALSDTVITNAAEGVSVTANDGDYTINIEAVKATGTLNTVAKLESRNYTSKGLTGTDVKAGFMADTTGTATSATLVTYHDKADEITFGGNAPLTVSATFVDNITISSAADSTIKTVTLSDKAFGSLSDNDSINITTDGYALDNTINGTMIGGLSYAGQYNAANTFDNTMTAGEWIYRSAGADSKGFIAGTGTDSLSMIYHTAREHKFGLEGNVAFNDTLSGTEAAGYFNVASDLLNSKHNVTINPDLFADSQTKGATIASGSNNYRLVMNAADQVTLINKEQFDAETATYQLEGANKNGYIAENGILTYYEQGDHFSFVTSNDTLTAIAFNDTVAATTAAAQWFSITESGNDKYVKIMTDEAFAAKQTDGAKLTLDDYSVQKGYKADFTALISSDNTYSAASFKVGTEDGVAGVYTTAGMSSKNGYIKGDDETILVYHDAATNLTFTGTLKFNELSAGGDLSDFFTVDTAGMAITINSAALNSIQSNEAYLNAPDGYKLVLGSDVGQVTSTTPASFTNKTFTSSGADKAGYQLTSDTLLTYYDTAQSVTFLGTVTFKDNATAAENIKITKDDSGNKIVTVGYGAINTTASFVDGQLIRINDSNYTLAVDESLDGGSYSQLVSFVKTSGTSTAEDGSTIYNYLYKNGGADRDGFVSTGTNAFTYHLADEQVKFQGNLNFNDSIEATDLAGHFVISNDGTITIRNTAGDGSIFGENYDKYYLALADNSTTDHKLEIDATFTPTVGGAEQDENTLTGGNGQYTYKSSGAETPGYKIDDGKLVYRAPIETVVFNGDIALNTDSVSALNVKDGVITISKDAFASQTATNATLSVASYTLSDNSKTYTTPTLQVADGVTEWVYSDAELTNYKRTYKTAGYSTEGYKVEDTGLTYHAKTTDEVTFSGLGSSATTSNVTVGSDHVFVITSKDALDAKNIVVSGGAGDYKLSMAFDGVTDGTYTSDPETPATLSAVTDNKATYKTYKSAETYVADGTASIAYTAATGGDEITFTGLGSGASTENVQLTVGEKEFTVGAAALTTMGVSIDNEAYTLTLTDDVKQASWTVGSSESFDPVADQAAVYKHYDTVGAYWTKSSDRAYGYTPETVNPTELFNISGVASVNNGMVSGNAVNVAYSDVATNAAVVSLSTLSGAKDAYTLTLTGVDSMPTTTESFAFGDVVSDAATYSSSLYSSEYWTKATDAEAYNKTAAATVTSDLFSLSGITTVYSGMVSGNAVNVAYSDVATNAAVVSLSTLSGDAYTLTLTGVDSVSHDTVSAEFGSITSGAATYTQTTLTSEYWTKSDSLEAYNKTGADTLTADLFSLSGITTVYSGMVSGNAVNVAYSDVATNAAVVSLSTLSGDAYTLTLTGVDSMSHDTVSAEFGSITSGAATYTQTTLTSEYWTKSDSLEAYNKTGADTLTAELFSLNGVASVNNGMVSGNAVNVAYSDVATNAAVVSLSTLSGDAYTLTLTGVDSMPTTTESFAFGDVTNNTATYTSSLHSSEYWTKATDAESYSRTEETVTSAELFSLSGIATVYSGMVSGNAVTVGKDDVASGATVVSMSKGQDVETLGYTLTLTGVDSVSHDTVRAEFGDITDNTAIYKQSTLSSDYWTKSETEQSYTHHEETISATADLFSLNGVASVYSGMVNGQAVSVAYSDLASGVSAVSLSTLSGDAYTLTLTGVDSAPATSESFAFGDVTNNTATYTSSLYSGEYWTKASDAEAYNKTDATVTTANQFTLTGINTVYSGMVSGQAVTVTGDDLASGVSSLTLTQGQGDTYSLTLTGVETEAKATATVGAFGGVADNEAIYQQTATIGAYWTKADSGEAYNQIGETVSSSNLFTLSGVSAVDDSIVSGSTVTIGLANMVDSITPVSLTGDNYTLALGSGLDAAETVSAKKFDAETGTYTTAGVGTGYTVGNSGKTISYIGEDEATSKVFVLTGLASTASKAKNSFNVDEENKKLEIGSLAVPTDGSTVTLVQAPEGYTLALGSTIADQASETVNAKKFDAETGTYTTAGTGEGYVLSNNDMSISYITEAQATSKVFQFTGLADTASKAKNSFNVDEDNKKIEIGYLAAPTDGSTATLVKAPEGYSLALGSSIADQASETVSAKKFDAETGTYTTAGTGEGFVLGENDMSISYITEAQATSKVFRFTGLASTASKAKNSFNIDEENKKVEIGSLAAPTDGSTATLVQAPEGYTLALGSTIADQASETVSAKKYDSKTQTYTTAGTGEGFVLSDNDMSISYITEAEATSKVFRFEGLKSTASKAKNSFNVDEDNKKIEIGYLAAPTDGSTATLVQGPEGYTLALGSSIADKASETIANTYDEENSTYRTAGTTEGYALGDDSLSVSYVTEDKATSQQFVFSNVADTAVTRSFSASDGEIRVATTAIKTDGTALKLESAPDGYKLAMGSSVKKRAATTGGTLSDDVYTYGTTAGYVLNSEENSIYYNAEADNKLKLSGVASKIKDPSNGIVTLKAANFSTEITVEENTDNYSFIIGTGTYTGKTFTGSSSADTVTVSGTNVSVNGGAGNDIVTVNGKGGTVVGGFGADTLIGGSNADYLLGGAGADSLSGGAGADTLSGGGGADTLDGGAGNDSLDGGAGNDSLSGGAGKDTLLGGAGNDTLWGGAGNDALYGGAGKDTFVYRPNEGTDTIYDFDSSDMLQIVDSSGKQVGYTSATFASSRLTLSIDGGGTVVLRDMSNGDKVNINGTTRTIRNGTLK